MKGYIAQRRGRYYVVIYEGRDPVTGKERRSWHPAGTDRADRAEAERLTKKLAATETKRMGAARSLTFGAYLTSQWLPAFPIIWLTAMTGMRRNEVLGLKWPDIDFNKKRIHLNQGIIAVGYEVHQTRGKTRSARRPIELDATTVRVLEGWRAFQAAEFAAVGIDNTDEWAFTDGNGDTVHPHAVYQAFRRIVDNAGVPALRFHDLRHTHGTLLIKEGIPVKVVSERLGHANIAHTMQTYQHVLPGMQAEAADITERLANPQPKANDPASTKADARKRKTSTKATISKKPTQKAAKPARKTPGERRGNNRRKAA